MAQQGFQYEINAANILKKMGVVPNDFRPAGASSNQPDLIIVKNGIKSGCELKISAASAGSLVLKYDLKAGWGFGDIKPDDEEKLFIRDLAYEIRILDKIKTEWKEEPAKREKQNRDLKWNALYGKMTDAEMYDRDKKLFKDVKGEISATKIEEYYNKKDTYYVNVGTHGFYLMGTRNPLNLNNVPRFSSAAKAMYRARVQYKGGGKYQFTFEMQFSIPSSKKSPYNIAPVDGKSATIIEKNLALAPANSW